MSGGSGHLSPLWWVARRSIRMLTCLAIAVLALSAGSADQPYRSWGATSPAHVVTLPPSAAVQGTAPADLTESTRPGTALSQDTTDARGPGPIDFATRATRSLTGYAPDSAAQERTGPADAGLASGPASQVAGPRAPPRR
ncbi:hypothetical protein [Micromonospora sp. LOL_023]|uniref:hypothetical protein n=1 Tax=Micromonospora sp. LOL_023 TaxID=3345418 RepID=UPI003A874C09